MKKLVISILLVGVLPAIVFAHLCNDVFMQAKDNLAVKVDIRDGQLRISDNAKFKVYLLNTMDRDIDDIHLEVLTKEFDTIVSPSSEWHYFPRLVVGKKQHFEVELARKPGMEPGKYQLALRLFSGERDFKTVSLEEAALPEEDALKVPEHSEPLTVDGKVSSAEWKDSLLCTSLYEYGADFTRVPSEVQTRFRFSRYKDTLYCLIDFMQQTDYDRARIYVASDQASKPTVFIADLRENKVIVRGKKEITINSAVEGNRMEIELPFDVLNVKDQHSFYVNVTRDFDYSVRTYWRGNKRVVTNPLVYANFVL